MDHFPQKSLLRSVAVLRQCLKHWNGRMPLPLGLAELGFWPGHRGKAWSRYQFPCLRSLWAWFSLLKPKDCFPAVAEVLDVQGTAIPAVPRVAGCPDIGVGDDP